MGDGNQPARKPNAIEQFTGYVAQDAFPCLAAKTASAREQLDFLVAEDLNHDSYDAQIVTRARRFADTIKQEDTFHSFVVCFPDTPIGTEQDFERALWERLQALHRLDARTAQWDPEVSCDPASPHFSFSLGGHAFYVVGLHPGSSRRARRFPITALVFNLHSQFDALRAQGRYERFRDAIVERDVAFSGSVNPMLATHGDGLEAPQYSGRSVDEAWRCPFHAVTR
jgi:FPC/CPF motif-containing protein YcgG